MARVFVRKRRRRGGPGTARPQYAVVATEGVDLKFYRLSLRKSELHFLADMVDAEVIYLPSGGEGGGGGDAEGKSDQSETEVRDHAPRHHRRHNR